MLKYVDAKVTFAEIPNEICLCIDFSNCPFNCEGCHSSYLQEDTGEYLSSDKLNELIIRNEGITCVCLMGGDREPAYIASLAAFIKDNYPYKVAWYSGNVHIPDCLNLDNFDYIKLGSYNKDKGGLNSPTTNQRLYKIENITHEFWRDKP